MMKNVLAIAINGTFITDIPNNRELRTITSKLSIKKSQNLYRSMAARLSEDKQLDRPPPFNLNPTASREQLPLVLGWAMTIHKSQGLTLSHVVLDLGEMK